ncbi:hypothetical protein JCM8547_004571 [Rhodosporidiobolus lusitaniae]
MTAFDGLSLAGGANGAEGLLKSRTRELQHDPLLAPPANPPPSLDSSLLPTLAQHSASPLPSAALAFAKRPRAGTLPSTFHLPSSTASSSVARPSLLGDNLLPPPFPPTGSASLPGSGPTTPLDLPFPSALLPHSATASVANSHSRLRSGSLTLPSSGLSSAFGPSVFSSGDWTPLEQRTPQPRSTLSTTATAAMDDFKSPDGSAYGDDQHVRTLDYLGLAEETPTSNGTFDGAGEGGLSVSGASPSPASSSLVPPAAPAMHRLGSAGSILPSPNQFSDISHQHSRLRSNTVAAFPRSSPSESLLRPFHAPSSSVSYPSSVVGGPTATAPFQGDDMQSNSGSSFHRSTPSVDSARLLYATAAALPSPTDENRHTPSPSGPPLVSLRPPEDTSNGHLPGRGRAATIGILDEGKDVFPRRRSGTTVGIPPRHLGVGALGSEGAGPAASMASRMGRLSISEDQPVWPGSSRPRTPEGAVSLTPPLQQPTRSLWVGNLDPKTTPAELQAVFAPYGAIESLRLIPEKECGFVNFVSVADAMHAKEDVLNRLGGQLTKTSGLVRIGYGKAESTPAPTAPGLVHPRSTAAGGTILTSSADLNLQTQPTRALWIGSIPSTTTPNHLLAIFSSFGSIESARVLTHKSCGFVNFERLDDAVTARKALNGREILGAEVGAVRIGYAKVPTKVANGPFPNHLNGDGTPVSSNGNNNGAAPPPPLGSYAQVYGALSQLSGVSGIPVEKQMADGQVQDYRSNMLLGVVSNGHYASAHAFAGQAQAQAVGGGGGAGAGGPVYVGGLVLGETVKGTVNEMQLLMRELSGGDENVEEDVGAVAKNREPVTYYTSIPLAVLNDPRWARRYTQNDAPRLREIRKRLDGEPPQSEVDTMAYDLLDEVVPLASDYIGNTIVQKLFEQCSTATRKAMLERIAPHLAPIGTHKNGTWAVQKIIQCAQDEDEYAIIEQNLAPYTPPLLLNDFGNYVVQGALRFGSPQSDFVFDSMVDRIWEIGSGRFGARSTRQTLENAASPRVQIKRVAAAILLNIIPLATSSNGSLLVTWLLESSGLPQRYSLAAARFAPHLSHAMSHRLAAQSVLRVVNQSTDTNARDTILNSLLDNDNDVLKDVLQDANHGAASIAKLAGSTFLDEADRNRLYESVKIVLDSLNAQSNPAYKSLIETIGGVYTGPPSGNTPPSGPSHSPNYRGGGSSPVQQFQPGRRPPPTHFQQPLPFYPPPPQPGMYQPYPPYPQPAYPYPSQFSPPYPSPTSFPPSNGGPGTTSGGPATPSRSPLVSHSAVPPQPFSPGPGPPFSPASPNPFGAFGEGSQAGFNPLFSPGIAASPPPPFAYQQGLPQQFAPPHAHPFPEFQQGQK